MNAVYLGALPKYGAVTKQALYVVQDDFCIYQIQKSLPELSKVISKKKFEEKLGQVLSVLSEVGGAYAFYQEKHKFASTKAVKVPPKYMRDRTGAIRKTAEAYKTTVGAQAKARSGGFVSKLSKALNIYTAVDTGIDVVKYIKGDLSGADLGINLTQTATTFGAGTAHPVAGFIVAGLWYLIDERDRERGPISEAVYNDLLLNRYVNRSDNTRIIRQEFPSIFK